MRLLVAGITYMSRINWDKFIVKASLYPDSEIKVIFPDNGYDALGKKQVGSPASFGNLEFIPVKTWLTRYETVHFYGSEYKELIKSFKPDVIIVEHGSYALSLTQTILIAKRYVPKAKILFFTWWNLPYTLSPPRKLIELFNFKMVSGAIVGNQDAKDILQERGFQAPIEIIPLLGVDENVYKRTPQPELYSSLRLNGEVILLFAGRIVKEKGIETMLKAMKRLVQMNLGTPWKLLVVGSGSYENEAKDLSHKLGLDGIVKFFPPVDHYGVIKYLSIADIFILPSETVPYWKEQFGHVIIEAMVCETVIVGSDSGEIPNVIGDGGLVFHERNDEELANSLARLIDDTEYRQTVAHAGKRRVLDNYTHKRISQRTMEWIQN